MEMCNSADLGNIVNYKYVKAINFQFDFHTLFIIKRILICQ